MNKKAGILAVLTLCGTVLAACGSSTKENPAPAAGTGGQDQSAAAVEKKLVVAGNGATVEQLMKDEVFKKFNEKYPDVKLTYVAGVATEIVAKVKAQKASPQIDVTIIEAGEQEAGRVEGLWEPITEKDVPSISKVSPELKVNENSGVAVNFTPMGISYNAALVQSKGLPVPESWNDLARPEMKGNLTLSEISSNFGRSALIMLSYANGGSEKDMEPGFKKLETIAGYMPTFAKNAAQLQQNLQNQTAAYTAWTMARSLVQKDAGLDLQFVIPKEGSNLVPTVASVVKGTKSPNAAKLFVEFLLSDEVQTSFATKLYYNPATNVKLPDDISNKLKVDMSKAVKFDYAVLSSESSKWLDRFNKEIAPKVGK